MSIHRSPAGSGDVPPEPMRAARLPYSRIRILLLAANPLSTGRSAVDEEARAIAERLRLSRDRDRFELITCWAVQPAHLLQYLNQYRPHVVHFSGHGTAAGELLLSAGDGTDKPVGVAALAELFRVMRDDIRIVLLNACYTAPQAKAIHQYIDFVTGTSAAITDRESTAVFAAAFYSALGFARTVPQAFDQARAALMMHGLSDHDLPELLARPDADLLMFGGGGPETKAADVRDAGHLAEPRIAGPSTNPAGRFQAARSRQRQPASPPEPTFVVTYAGTDAEYGIRLVDWLNQSGLPAWSIADLTWGSHWVYEIRQRLRNALAVVVVMSPAAEESEDVDREILEGQWYGREFFPVLLLGDRNFLLASSWYFDARGGLMPGDAELRQLRRIHQAHLAGRPTDPPRPMMSPVPAPVARPTDGIPLRRLHAFLKEGEFVHADLLTTSLVLAAAKRLEAGWMDRRDARKIPASLLTGIDAAWSEHTGGRQGFRRQLDLCRLKSGGGTEFLDLAKAYGWKMPAAGGPTFGERHGTRMYHEFVDRSPVPSGFFPTLRNQQIEVYPGWYGRWRKTVIALHLNLRERGTEMDHPWA